MGISMSSRAGILVTVPFRAFLSRSSHVGTVTMGASSPVRRLNATEERLLSLTSITSPTRHQIRRNVDLLTVHGEVGMVHQLTGLAAGHGKAQTIHHIVQTALHQAQQVLAGLAGHTGSLLIVHTELLFQMP